MKYPRIHLAIDNCFAYKRWTSPFEWAKVIKGLGVNYIEASADTELDPLYMCEEYLRDWVCEIKLVEKELDIKVANLYSGHGTYTTLGLTHTDARVRRHMIEKWFKPFVRMAAELDAGAGFFAHAFSETVMQDPSKYNEYCEILIDGLCEICTYAKEAGCKYVALEQMYTPHMVPWRINDAAKLISEVTKRSGSALYITEDVGHHHIKFVRPTDEMILQGLETGKVPWLGAARAYEVFDACRGGSHSKYEALLKINSIIEEYPHMFAEKRDGDCYEWIRELGTHFPIIHVQQTDGMRSAHWHFTSDNNKKGIIKPLEVLMALKESYDRPIKNGMPPRTDNIYITLEAFSETVATSYEITKNYQESVLYWRQFIPVDGLTLDVLLKERT